MTSPSRLEEELARLIDQGVLAADQADALRAAAAADRAGPPPDGLGDAGVDSTAGGGAATGGGPGLLDVLGYAGGALVLGALLFLGFTLWDDLSSTARRLVAVAAAVVPAVGGFALLRTGNRRVVGLVLLALACVAAGFAAHVLTGNDEHFLIAALVVLATSAVGVGLTRSGVLLVPSWIGAMGLVLAVLAESDDTGSDHTVLILSIGFALVGAAFAVVGRWLARPVAWTLAGLSGWAVAGVLLGNETVGGPLSLAVASLVAAALFTAFARARNGVPYAVVACLILLSMWPAALYRIVDSALGVVLGLVAAGAVLIAAAVVFGRRAAARRRAPGRRNPLS